MADFADAQPQGPASASLRERWIAWRNAMLRDERFHAFASRFPFTRPIAARRAQDLFDVVAGFVYSQIAAACVRSAALDAVADAPLGEHEFARRVGLPADATARLVTAAAALGLLERLGDRVALGPQGAALIGTPGLAEMILHHDRLYADLADPIAVLRRDRGALSTYWGYAAAGDPRALDGADVAAYSRLMAASQPMVAAQGLAVAPLRDRAVLMDVGGGEGGFIEAAAARWPHLRFVLFDLPAVVERARARLEPLGIAERVRFVGGDFRRDPLPIGADAISFVRVLHDHDDSVVETLLARARQALPPGGRALVLEPMAGSRVGDAYFGLYLAAMGSGRARSARALAAMLRQAGFSRARRLSTAMPMIADAIWANV
jgi:demethylspheroidene O-methyltransferase